MQALVAKVFKKFNGLETINANIIGWERLTQAAIEALKQKEVVVWFLFGPELQKLESLITNPKHKIIKCEHPELAYKEKSLPIEWYF